MRVEKVCVCVGGDFIEVPIIGAIGLCFSISRLFYVYIKAVCMLLFFRLHFKQPHGGLLLSANDASYVYVITVLERAAEIRCNSQWHLQWRATDVALRDVQGEWGIMPVAHPRPPSAQAVALDVEVHLAHQPSRDNVATNGFKIWGMPFL